MCKGCGFFQTTLEFRSNLERQRDHARDHGQRGRIDLFDKLLVGGDRDTALTAIRPPAGLLGVRPITVISADT